MAINQSNQVMNEENGKVSPEACLADKIRQHYSVSLQDHRSGISYPRKMRNCLGYKEAKTRPIKGFNLLLK